MITQPGATIDEIECPYCGHRHDARWDTEDGSGLKRQCDACGRAFEYGTEAAMLFTSYPVEQELGEILDRGRSSAKVIPREFQGLDIKALCDRIQRAAEIHPEGPSLAALVEEVGEVARAMQDSPDRMGEELLDVAVVALRWHMEVGREP